MSDIFRDWIPEGEDTGSIGTGGFVDFVPAPEPKQQIIEEKVVNADSGLVETITDETLVSIPNMSYRELQIKANKLGFNAIGAKREDLEKIIAASERRPLEPLVPEVDEENKL